MEEIKLEEENHWVLWRVDIEQAQKDVIGWRMLENNQIAGILPFDYYYVDNQICFRIAYHSLQRIENYFQKKTGDFETLCFLCEEILTVLERGQEYLLASGGYLLLPEWIFWNRFEKKVSLCYLPGKKGDAGKEFTKLIEYLMRYTDHSDKRAVTMIYGLYDMLLSDGFVPGNLLLYLQDMEHGKSEGDSNAGKKAGAYALKPIWNNKTDKLSERFLQGCGKEYLVGQGEIVIGRKAGSDLYLPFGEVSRRHAVIICEAENVYLMDTASANGTFVNGNKISAYVKTPCKENDIVTFADISFKLVRNN